MKCGAARLWWLQTLLCFISLLLPPAAVTDTEARLNLTEPPVNFDITNARVWRCSHPGPSVLKELHSSGHALQLEVLAMREDWIEIVTSADESDMPMLQNCAAIASLPDLIAAELRENWQSLKHHVSRTVGNLTTNNSFHMQVDRIRLKAVDSAHIGQTERNSVLKRSPKEPESNCREGVCCESSQDGQLKPSREEEWFTYYHNLTEVYSWFRELAAAHSSMVTLNTSIGKSFYGRNIISVHITDRSSSEYKHKIYFQCLLHAREWITGSVCMYLARYLVTPDPSNLILKDLLKNLEFVMVPVANPDGYYLTWLQYPKYRLWRKNASPLNNTECAGVDLNRNFDVGWGTGNSVSDPCGELYQGPHVASELEVQAITAYIQSIGPIYGAIDFHSYYQEVMYPPAWTTDDSDSIHGMTLEYVAQWVAAAASQVGVTYTAQRMSSVYTASGTFTDWIFANGHKSTGEEAHPERQKLHCVIPITIELRPKYNKDSKDTKDTYSGFMLPKSEILPACQEMVPAVVKFSQLVLEEGAKCNKLYGVAPGNTITGTDTILGTAVPRSLINNLFHPLSSWGCSGRGLWFGSLFSSS